MAGFLSLLFSVQLAFALLASANVAPWTPPLHTNGRYVVDADGNRFKLKSGNWHGGSGTWNGDGDINVDSNHHSNENSHTLPLGLQYAPINDILDSYEQLGINSIRLQFSNEMIHDSNKVQDAWVSANPQFKGLTPLEVYDRVVEALTARGFAVILNNHTNKSKWCCGANDGNDRWNKSISDDQWIADWVFMAQRYKNNARVAGADLYNEVRRDLLDDPNWGLNDSHDWYLASQHAGDRILTDGNPNILIIVEGINWAGIPVDGFYHHRPTLEPVRQLSHTLLKSDKLVYSAHFYGYTGPSHSGATGIGETSDLRYRDYDHDGLFQVMTDQAGYVALDADKHYTRPVWISEFGIGRSSSDIDTRWWKNTIDYLIQKDMDFAYWPLMGYLGPNNSNGWALVNYNPSNGQKNTEADWRLDDMKRLVSSGRTGNIPQAAQWSMLNLDNEDAVKSLTIRSRGDFDSGARKGVCPDGQRLLGVSRGHRALCTDTVFGDLWASGQPTQFVNSEQYVNGGDWASGYTKYQCPNDFYVIGFAVRGTKVSSVLCAKSVRSLGTQQYTRWFDQGDNKPGDLGGDFHSGQYKAVCEANEYIAGIAFTTRVFSSPNAAAVLCRK